MKRLFQIPVGFTHAILSLPRFWVGWIFLLVLVNMGALLFLPRIEAVVMLAATLMGAFIQMAIFSRLGYVKLLGIGHVPWVPVLIWIVTRLEAIKAEPLYYKWILVLLVMNGISLVIDTIDVVRFARGERASLRPKGVS